MLARMGLAMQYCSARMVLFRSCLCRFEGRLKNQSEDSKDFNKVGVEACIHSARRMIHLISWSASSVEKLYCVTPWWNTLHYICEALSVLMLEMAFKATHLRKESAYILEDAKKGIRWLAMMAAQSVSARKAWEIFDSLLRTVAPMISWSVFDMPNEAPVPPGWNWRRFNTTNFSPQPTMAPQQQLSEKNLQQYSSQSHSQGVANWQSATDFSLHEPFEQLANPLDPSTALQRFAQIGQVHGHYDDPWQSLFAVSNASPAQSFPATATAPAPDMMLPTQAQSYADQIYGNFGAVQYRPPPPVQPYPMHPAPRGGDSSGSGGDPASGGSRSNDSLPTPNTPPSPLKRSKQVRCVRIRT